MFSSAKRKRGTSVYEKSGIRKDEKKYAIDFMCDLPPNHTDPCIVSALANSLAGASTAKNLSIAAGLIVLSIIAGVVISFIKTKARPLKEGDAKLLEILLLSWVPTAGLVYHSMFTHAEMRTEFRMYILLYVFVIIGCCLGLIRQKNALQRTGKND